MPNAHRHRIEPAADEGDWSARSSASGALRLGQWITLVAGMIGVRIDRKTQRWWAIALGVGSCFLALAFVAADRTWAYVVGAWALYYLGNPLLLTGPAHRALRRHLDERRAYALYELALGAMFVNQGLAVSVASSLDPPGAVGLPIVLAKGLAVLVFVLGFGCKLWATRLTGLDIYYYRDMFTSRSLAELVAHGPYRWLSNPMYGLGNVHMYAVALWFRSWTALACAVAFHASIYVFYLFVERPFVQRVYGEAEEAESAATPALTTR